MTNNYIYSTNTVYNDKINIVINNAIDILKNSSVSSYINKVILYGSCARGEANEYSDVDIFIELSSKSDHEVRRELRCLVSDMNDFDIDYPECDVHFVVSNEWEKQLSHLYYALIKEEGVSIWD